MKGIARLKKSLAHPSLLPLSDTGGHARDVIVRTRCVRGACPHRGCAFSYLVIKTHKSPMKPRFIAGGLGNALQTPNRWLHRALLALLPDVHALFAKLTTAREDMHIPGRFAQPPVGCWVVSSSRDVVQRVCECST